jgi:hypothetical protein
MLLGVRLQECTSAAFRRNGWLLAAFERYVETVDPSAQRRGSAGREPRARRHPFAAAKSFVHAPRSTQLVEAHNEGEFATSVEDDL